MHATIKTKPELLKADSSSSSSSTQQRQQVVVKEEEHPSEVVVGAGEAASNGGESSQNVASSSLSSSSSSTLPLTDDCSAPTTATTTTTTNANMSAANASSNTPSPTTSTMTTSQDRIQSMLATKKRIIHRYFDELSQTYIQLHNRDIDQFELHNHQQQRVDRTKSSSQSLVLDKLRNSVSKITTYSEIRSIASVNYNNDSYSMSSIVSSVDFDKSYEHFAMAGVTKRIKIFDFANILDRPYAVHYPLSEMVHNAKLSCVSWNRYFRQQLACSDYDGVVTLWDAETSTLMRSYQEHEKRCWGVQFCDVDPRLLASASDDSKVKIWSTNSKQQQKLNYSHTNSSASALVLLMFYFKIVEDLFFQFPISM